MNIFIDTSVKGCNIALFNEGEILSSVQEPIERGHAETILPLFETLIQKTHHSSQDIENIYTTIGPGSFTGLRVGLSVARFMGVSLAKPVKGMTSFQAFSCGVQSDKDRLVLIETKRSDFYCQLLDVNHNPIAEAQSISADHINVPDNVIVTGDAVERFVAETGYAGEVIAQEMVDVQSVVRALQEEKIQTQNPDPFYIRDADVSQPKKVNTR